jgi:hypothetical protein
LTRARGRITLASIRKEAEMAKDLTVVLEHQPGTLAALGEATGGAGVNIDGICAVTVGGQGEIHLLVEDADAARRALGGAGFTVREERDVIVHEVEDRPGVVGEVARRVADAGVNIELVYLATGTRMVIGANDLEKARGAL